MFVGIKALDSYENPPIDALDSIIKGAACTCVLSLFYSLREEALDIAICIE